MCLLMESATLAVRCPSVAEFGPLFGSPFSDFRPHLPPFLLHTKASSNIHSFPLQVGSPYHDVGLPLWRFRHRSLVSLRFRDILRDAAFRPTRGRHIFPTATEGRYGIEEDSVDNSLSAVVDQNRLWLNRVRCETLDSCHDSRPQPNLYSRLERRFIPNANSSTAALFSRKLL